MFSMQTAGLLLVSALFAVIGFYLTSIAKFYRQKFSKGPPHRFMQGTLAVLVSGQVLGLEYFHFLPTYLPSALVCAGGIGFSVLSYLLYRTMMSVN